MKEIFQNRRQRRAALKSKPFIGNGKQIPLTISGVLKYVRRIQEIKLSNGTIKRIKHYVLRDKI